MPDSIGHSLQSAVRPLIALIGILLLILGIGYLGYQSNQQNFYGICLGYCMAFWGYIWLTRQILPIWSIFLAAIVGRILLIPAFPTLSDDIYRYIWDGHLFLKGISPFAYTPTSLLDFNPDFDTHHIYPKLNSPDYYSIYPPVSQLCFAISAWFSSSIIVNTMILKSCILIIELIGLWAMFRLLKNITTDNIKWFLLYALNPLLIVEVYGNVHLEGLAIGFAIWSVYAVQCKKALSAGSLLALAVGSKLIPLVLFPFLWLRLEKSLRLRFTASFITVNLLLFLPVILSLDIGHFLTSLDLYFRKFEFNASIYYLQRAIGEWISGYNLIQYIGPLNAIIVLYIAARKWMQHQKDNPIDLVKAMQSVLIILLAFYLTTTTMHPWYVVYLIAFGVLIQNPIGIIWSSLIWISYHFYHQGQWIQHPALWSLQYLPLLGFIAWQYHNHVYANNGSLR